jgi:hypothetical protein
MWEHLATCDARALEYIKGLDQITRYAQRYTGLCTQQLIGDVTWAIGGLLVLSATLAFVYILWGHNHD